MSLDTALKRPALYNPALWSRDEVCTYYVARHRLLERFLDDFRREKAGTRPQHRLIIGQRGMGKSTLLRRLAIGVDDDAELAGQWLPLVFPEEQYNVATLADFWLNCLDALGDFLEARGDVAEMKAIDAEVERLDRKDGEGALQTLLRQAKKQGRRLLLLVDNIDLILERIKKQQWALREVLQEHPELLMVGASSRALEATYDYGAAFYDFFKIDELRGLTEVEMRETIVALARQRGAEEVVRRVESDPGRLRVLHTLTGGNPRTAVLLYGVLLKGVDGDVRSDLEALLDEVTPLYKARFDELPTQAQQLLDKVALHWDPISARQAADALGWTVNLASAQLDRLVQAGVVEKVKAGSGKRMAFQVAERFFNIWYLMRASRRVRRKLMWLVEFLRVSFSSESNMAEAEYMLANGSAAISHALETRALDYLIRDGRVGEMLDLSGEERDLAEDPALADWLLTNNLPLRNFDDEALIVARRWFDALVHKEEILAEDVSQLQVLLRGTVVKKRAADFLVALDASGASERFRPAREALAAAVAGTADVLNGVAPEVRKPALDILAIIAPDLVSPEMLAAPL